MPSRLALAGVAVAYVVVGASCYHPELRDCTVECSSQKDCAGSQMCLGGWCAMPGAPACREMQAAIDATAATQEDASTIGPSDASDLCVQGCPRGTCIDGVCVIDCTATGSCPNDVACPANLPCRVLCGDGACGNKISCNLASSCEILCTGTNACSDEIHCMDVPCDVTCSGTGSCKKRIRCASSCGCDVTCTGSGSCAEVSECPMASCRVGNGCSTLPAGCYTCS